MLADQFPGRSVRFISAQTGEGVDEWIDAVLTGRVAGERITTVDYDRYARGEAVLGWLNATCNLSATSGTVDWQGFCRELLESFKDEFAKRAASVGHVKIMLSTPHVIAALRAKAGALAAYQAEAGRQAAGYARALEALAARSEAEVLRALEAIPRPGARPTAERVAGRPVVRPFCERWENHAEARAWALERLRGVPVLAVDGSQITPSTDYSVPIGAVQVGWFVNRHDSALPYEKDIRFEVLVPDDLEVEGASESFPDLQVNVRRFELECRVLIEAMERHSGRNPTPVCLLDGSLALSFAAQLSPDLQLRYVNAVRALLDATEQTRVPVVGYVDSSYAGDLVALLAHLEHCTPPRAISDALLLSHAMAWGDRTEALTCARDDHLFALTPDLDYYHRVLFTYCKTTAPNPPARLDVPAWVLDAGLLNHVIDVVRAECIIGTGYPYAAETADAVAVLSLSDRERFYRTVQEYSQQLGIDLRYARKAASKRARR